MASTYTCDKCGKSIHGYPVDITKLEAFRVMDLESLLCSSCAKDLRKVMRDWIQDGGEVTERDIRTRDGAGDVYIYYRGVLAGGIDYRIFTDDRALELVRNRERRRRAMSAARTEERAEKIIGRYRSVIHSMYGAMGGASQNVAAAEAKIAEIENVEVEDFEEEELYLATVDEDADRERGKSE